MFRCKNVILHIQRENAIEKGKNPLKHVLRFIICVSHTVGMHIFSWLRVFTPLVGGISCENATE